MMFKGCPARFTLIILTMLLTFSCGNENLSTTSPDTQAGIVLRHLTDGNNDIEYPVISGLSQSGTEDAINIAIQKIVFDFVDSTTAGFERTDHTADPRNPELEIWVEYLVGINAGSILSLEFTLSWFAGGAHPMSYLRGLTVDLVTGKVLTLSDLFSDESTYVDGISEIVTAGFAESKMPLLEEFVNIAPDNEYYLSGDGIVLFFQRYEYTPYAYGFPKFTIPYEQCNNFGLKYNKLLEIGR